MEETLAWWVVPVTAVPQRARRVFNEAPFFIFYSRLILESGGFVA